MLESVGYVTFRKATAKGKLATREIDIHPKLAVLLATYDNGRAGWGEHP